LSRGGLAALVLAAALSAPAGAGEEPLASHVETGPVSADVRVTPAEPVIGDPLLLELEVRAEPGVELLMPEFGEALGRFAITAFAPAAEIADDGGTIARQRYTLQPARSGEQTVPPLLVEFVDRRPGRDPAPEGLDAYELLTERIDFEVSSVLPPDAPLEPRPPLGPLPPMAGPAAPRWPWVVGAVVVLAAAAPFAARSFLAARSRSRRRSAYEVARGELDALLYGPRPDASGMDAFFVKLSGIVRRYLETRFGLLAPELTTEEFLDALSSSPELVRSHRELLQGFLHRADLVKFAHHVPDRAALQDSIDSAQRFLEETREAAGG
jgi:HAMP domain-containing protein